MAEVAWVAIGLLGASVFGTFAGFFYLGARIDAQGTRLDARIDALGAKVDAQGADLGAWIDAQSASLGARIDALTERLDEHLGRHAS